MAESVESGGAVTYERRRDGRIKSDPREKESGAGGRQDSSQAGVYTYTRGSQLNGRHVRDVRET